MLLEAFRRRALLSIFGDTSNGLDESDEVSIWQRMKKCILSLVAMSQRITKWVARPVSKYSYTRCELWVNLMCKSASPVFISKPFPTEDHGRKDPTVISFKTSLNPVTMNKHVRNCPPLKSLGEVTAHRKHGEALLGA